MNGINSVVIGGNVGKRIIYGNTAKGVPSCSFDVCSEQGPDSVVWITINAYGSKLIESCVNFLAIGVYAVIEGELMSRMSQDGSRRTEVRAAGLLFFGPAQKIVRSTDNDMKEKTNVEK